MKHFLLISLLLLSVNTYSESGKITGENVNFRSDTLLNSDNVIKQLNYWNNILIIEKGAKWTKIKHLDDIGYVNSEFISETFSFFKFIKNLSVFQILLILVLLTSFFLPRLLMSLIIRIENQKGYEYSERKFTEKLSNIFNNTKIENFYHQLIGNSFYETSSWILRISAILIIPIILTVIKIVFDYFILEEAYQLNIGLFNSTIYNLVLSVLFLLIVILILTGILYEILTSKSKVEIFRIPLLLMTAFYMIPISFFALVWGLIILLFMVFRKILKAIRWILPVILNIFLIFLNAFNVANKIGNRRDGHYY